MPRNGSGIYGPPAGTAAVPNTTIESADYNSVVADISQALTDSINVDGTAPFQGNQSMGDNKLINLGAGTAAADSVNLGQAQAGIIAHATATGGTADAITATFSPAFAAYTAKMRFRFTAGFANVVVNPTINVDGLGTRTIKKLNGAALEPGDIAGAGHVCDCVYDGTDVLLLNFAPMTGAEANVFTEKQTFNRPIVSPVSTLADAATIAWDMNATSANVRIVLSASRSLGAPTNINTGQSGLIIVQQDGTGGWSLTPNAIFKQSGGQTVFDLDSTANSKTVYNYQIIEDHSGVKVALVKRLWSEGKNSIGFWKEYDKGTFVLSGQTAQAHGLGRRPSLFEVWLENVVSDLSFTPGDRLRLASASDSDTAGRSVTQGVNATTVFINAGDVNPSIVNSSGNAAVITTNRWKVIFVVYE